MNELVNGQRGSADDYKALMSTTIPSTPFILSLSAAIEKNIKKLANDKDFSNYIKLLKICVSIAQFNENYLIRENLEKLHFAFFTFVDRPNMFDDVEQLDEVDRLHIQLYSSYFMYFKDWVASRETHRALLDMTLKNFDAIMVPKLNDTYV